MYFKKWNRMRKKLVCCIKRSIICWNISFKCVCFCVFTGYDVKCISCCGLQEESFTSTVLWSMKPIKRSLWMNDYEFTLRWILELLFYCLFLTLPSGTTVVHVCSYTFMFMQVCVCVCYSSRAVVIWLSHNVV